jgi:adenosyl cobinamide kinase/adenosyl cobinamide phosphate guanylyltransferase
MAQGKLDYVLGQTGLSKNDVARDMENAKERPVLYGLHDIIAKLLKDGRDPEREIEELITVNPDIIVVCNELGCGVVPIDPFERLWRDCVGRVCCMLALNAQRVERVLCGLPLVLKGEGEWS